MPPPRFNTVRYAGVLAAASRRQKGDPPLALLLGLFALALRRSRRG